MLSRYLREQGESCLRWGRQTFDLATAEKLREMGEEFIRKAKELEAQNPPEEISLSNSDENATDTGTAFDAGRDGA
jgi:hypothetical protein